MNNPSRDAARDAARDAGIPLLTEVIDTDSTQASAPDPAASTPPPVMAAPAVQASVEELEQRARASMGSEDWARLERALRERILRQLLARTDLSLEQRVRDSLADVLQGAVSNLASEIRGGLHASLEDLILRAVSQEITRLRSGKN